jgi:hypothetical protein
MSFLAIVREWRSAFAPRLVLLGALIGFAAMCGLGRYVAGIDYHPNFVRLTQWDSPEAKYYPTVNELIAIVRHEMKPGQILVIVGGNSVLRGVGQPPARIWTKRLQDELGSGYHVFDFSYDGSPAANGGAVVAEALRNQFPRQIYLANDTPTHGGGYPTGSPAYRFDNWEAYYKGMLLDDPVRNAEIKLSHAIPEYYNAEFAVPELKIREWLDRFCYFQDLWNYVTFTQVNTVWGSYLPSFLSPRGSYPDPEPDSLQSPLSARFPNDAAATAAEMAIVRGDSIYAYNKGPDGKWQIYQPVWDEFETEAHAVIPDGLKKRTLMLVGYPAPYFVSRLAPDEAERNDLTFQHSVAEWEKSGYESLIYGKDFVLDDYCDRIHLTSRGGNKLADLVAPKIRAMAQKLGYLSP